MTFTITARERVIQSALFPLLAKDEKATLALFAIIKQQADPT